MTLTLAFLTMSQLFAGLSLAVPPLLISTLAKHFLARKKITADNKARDEFLYDEVSELDYDRESGR